MLPLTQKKDGSVRRRIRPAADARVYFLRCAGSIKVGTSINVAARIGEINTSLPEDGELLGTIPGDRASEKRVHRRLANYHKRREWYVDCPEARAIINELLQNGGLPALSAEVLALKPSPPLRKPFDREFEPLKQLAEILSAYSRAEMYAIADRAGVPVTTVGRAAIGNGVGASNYFRVCAAAGFDPVAGTQIPQRALGEFNLGSFALGIKIRRRLRRQSLRAAAKAASIKHLVIHRAERQEPVSTEHTMILCGYIGVHPFNYCPETNDPRETAETPTAEQTPMVPA
jgi:hypothetical protein